MTDRRPPLYKRYFDLSLGGARADSEMDEELESHVAMRVADLVRAGMNDDDARTEARRRFGDYAEARRRLRDGARQRAAVARQRDRWGALVADAKFAVRQSRRAPGYSAVAVLTLAVGLGAATAMFSLVDHVLLRPLPYAQSNRLFALAGSDSARRPIETISKADLMDYRGARSIDVAATGFGYRQGIVTNDSAVVVNAARVSPNFFTVLGARLAAGRAFTDDDVASGAPVVMISERLWHSMFGGDRALADHLRTAARQYSIVGVVANGQEYPADRDVWFPANFVVNDEGARVNINWNAIGRLHPGFTPDMAKAELTTIAHRIRVSDPAAMYSYGVQLRPLADALVGDIGGYLSILMGVVAVVLLIVCTNVAAAGLARATTRAREMAVRASLGAGRRRLLTQLLIEQAWLGVLACGVGLFIAWMLVRVIIARWGADIPRASEVTIDGRVFVFAAVASLASSTLAGIVPALRVTGQSLRDTLASGGRTSARGGRNLAGASLVGAEVALALMLLVGAGLLIRSFRAVLSRDLGIDTNVATAQALLGGATYAEDADRRLAYWASLIREVRAVPGVRAVGVTSFVPLDFTGQGFIDILGKEIPGAGAVYRAVNGDFFTALGMTIESGRVFGEEDGPTTSRVVVINRTMAETYWPRENPIGRQVRARSMEGSGRGGAPWLTVIGVVSDIRTYGLESPPRPEMYALYSQVPKWSTGLSLLVRGDRSASQLLPEIKRRAHDVDPHVAIDVGTLADRLRRTLSTRTLILSLLSGFSAVALLLAALGVYGVLSYSVAQRSREIAVRAALGAQRRQLLRLVFGSGLRVVAAGLLAGLPGAVLLTRVIRSMLVDVTTFDPISYIGAALTLALVSLLAIAIPARRATTLDPIIALRAE